MKKILIPTVLLLLLSTLIHAQAPYTFNYQGVARNASGQPLIDQNISLKLSVMNGATVIYSETQDLVTNDFGLFTAIIGQGSDISGSLGTYSAVLPLSLKVELDPNGGSDYQDLGTTELQSVPYAITANVLSASNTGGLGGMVSQAISGMYVTIIEAGNYRGYIGSYSGNNEDVDFGTGAGNNTGSTHLTVKSVPKLTVDPMGRVGIGTTTPTTDLQIDHETSAGNNKGLTLNNTDGTASTNSWTFYTQASTGNLILYAGNNVIGTFNRTSGAYSSMSDLRLKMNITDEKEVLSKVMNIRPVHYNFKTNPNDPKVLGVIAQELQTQFPELITTLREDGLGEYKELLSVDYSGLSVVAIKAIQEQQAIIESLKAELKTLKAAVAQLQD